MKKCVLNFRPQSHSLLSFPCFETQHIPEIFKNFTNAIRHRSIKDRGHVPSNVCAGVNANKFVYSNNGMMIWNLSFSVLFQQAFTAEQAVISLIKCENFELKCVKNAFGGQALRGPAAGA